MTYENIKFKQDLKDRDGNKVVSTIDPYLQPLVEKLALEYPQWTFEEDRTDYQYVDGKRINYTARGFEVLDKREKLGEIALDHYRGGKRFFVNNFRVQQMRERGSGFKTIHLNKAVKYVDKYFGKKNIVEKMEDAKGKVEGVMYQVRMEKAHKEQRAWNVIQEQAKNYLLNKVWMEFALETGINVSDYPEKKLEWEVCQKVDKGLNNDTAHIVYIDGLDYAIQKGKEPLVVKSSEELPDYMRRGIGMLKLVEDKQIIDDVGMRVNAETFVILHKEEV